MQLGGMINYTALTIHTIAHNIPKGKHGAWLYFADFSLPFEVLYNNNNYNIGSFHHFADMLYLIMSIHVLKLLYK